MNRHSLAAALALTSVVGLVGCQRPEERAVTPAERSASYRAETELRTRAVQIPDELRAARPGGPAAAAAPQGGPFATGLDVDPNAPLPSLIETTAAQVSSITSQAGEFRDDALMVSVRDGILQDPSLRMSVHDLEVDVSDGKVTLRGWVRNAADKLAAGDLAREQAGSATVDNEIEVRGY